MTILDPKTTFLGSNPLRVPSDSLRYALTRCYVYKPLKGDTIADAIRSNANSNYFTLECLAKIKNPTEANVKYSQIDPAQDPIARCPL